MFLWPDKINLYDEVGTLFVISIILKYIRLYIYRCFCKMLNGNIFWTNVSEFILFVLLEHLLQWRKIVTTFKFNWTHILNHQSINSNISEPIVASSNYSHITTEPEKQIRKTNEYERSIFNYITPIKLDMQNKRRSAK